MPQPTPYSLTYSFGNFSSGSPSSQPPGVKLDDQFNAIAETIDGVLRSLKRVQRDDGALANHSVGVDQLSSSALAFIAAGAFAVRGPWVTATSYRTGDFYSFENQVFLVMEGHSSTDIASDVADGKVIGPIFYPENAQFDAVFDQLGSINGASMVKTSDGSTLATKLAQILAAQTVLSDMDGSISAKLALLGAANGTDTSFIVDLDSVQVGPVETLGQRFSQISASAAANTADILTEQAARATADAAEATARLALATTFGTTLSAAIASEATTRADADSAEATARLALASTVASNLTAAINSEATTRATADTAEATARLALAATVGTNLSAAISSEASARVSGDSAVASTVTSLSTTVGGLSSTVSTFSSSISGIQARYGISLNVNGHISGFSQNNSGSVSDFIVAANTFKVVAPGGGTAYTMFSVSAGKIVLNSNVAVNGNLVVSGSIVAASMATSAGYDLNGAVPGTFGSRWGALTSGSLSVGNVSDGATVSGSVVSFGTMASLTTYHRIRLKAQCSSYVISPDFSTPTVGRLKLMVKINGGAWTATGLEIANSNVGNSPSTTFSDIYLFSTFTGSAEFGLQMVTSGKAGQGYGQMELMEVTPWR